MAILRILLHTSCNIDSHDDSITLPIFMSLAINTAYTPIISVTGGYFTPAPVLISRFRGLSWMGLGLTPVGVGLEVCVVVVVVVVVTMIKGEYTSSCVPLSYRTIL